MNRSLFTLFAFLVAASVAMADPPDEDVLRPHVEGKSHWFFELDGGVNFNLLNGNSVYRDRNALEGITNIFESASGISPLLGLTAGYEFNQHLAVTLRADYDPRWTSNSGTVTDTCVLRDVLDPTVIVGRSPVDVDKEFHADVDYLTLSLQARITFRRLFIYLGPSLSFPMSATTSETDHIIDDSAECSYAPLDPTSPKTTSGTLSGSSIAAVRLAARIGLGYEFAIDDNWSFVPQVGIDVGLTHTFKSGDLVLLRTDTGVPTGSYQVNSGVMLNALQATIGIQYHL
jgi:hypothetical protein